jgi:hypothetical protein
MENSIITQFEKIGAKLKVEVVNPATLRMPGNVFDINVKKDDKEEYYAIRMHDIVKLNIVNVDKLRKHLVLHVKGENKAKESFLCGYDEKGWFVVNTNAPTVKAAFESLKPKEVIQSLTDNKVSKNKRNKRKNQGFKRQGEWFFVPEPNLILLNSGAILKNEPLGTDIRRAHICQFAVRRNAITVYVNSDYPNGLTEEEHKDLINKNPNKNYRFDVRNITNEFYVSGTVKHPDHKKIKLNGWYRVYHNIQVDQRNSNGALINGFID